jgi:hypothetical protein
MRAAAITNLMARGDSAFAHFAGWGHAATLAWAHAPGSMLTPALAGWNARLVILVAAKAALCILRVLPCLLRNASKKPLYFDVLKVMTEIRRTRRVCGRKSQLRTSAIRRVNCRISAPYQAQKKWPAADVRAKWFEVSCYEIGTYYFRACLISLSARFFASLAS